jgi:pyridoxal phosphate enzyme (YggS family)
LNKVLEDRLAIVENRIALACQRVGRKRSEVTLIAVTKVFKVDVMLEAYGVGLRHFGENYVQEFAGKFPHTAHMTEAHFHLIGHLQSNKSKTAAQLFHWIHTVDSARLAQRLEETQTNLQVMLEVKLSPEESKHGADPSQVAALKDAIEQTRTLKLAGLMTMPPWSEDPELSRPYFRKLRTIAEGAGLACLSMGMSHDLEVAIEEGATHVRIGTALFGRRQKP